MESANLSPKSSKIFFFGGKTDMEIPAKEILGGKGASLASMSSAGLNVPPGFTISTEMCKSFYENNQLVPEGLLDEVKTALSWLENLISRKLGVGPRPLLVSVRSGAALSMPGMMDTVLNVGLNPDLEQFYQDKQGFWNTYRDFVQLFSETVLNIDEKLISSIEKSLPSQLSSRERVLEIIAGIEKKGGRKFPTDPWDMLVKSIIAVFQSWNSERALQYRERHNIRGLPGTAVTVQSMFPSEYSGVLFSISPTDFDTKKIIIEASTGLGEAIVRGRVEPDSFIVDRDTLKIIEKKISRKDVQVRALAENQVDSCKLEGSRSLPEGKENRPEGSLNLTDGEALQTDVSRSQPHVQIKESKDSSELQGNKSQVQESAGRLSDQSFEDRENLQSLSDEQIIELVQLGLRVEKYFGHPIDLEWGYSDGKFGLLQSRPVRGFEVALDIPKALEEEKAFLTQMAGSNKKAAWALYNLSETLPAPLPLTWDIIGDFMSGSGGFVKMYKELGFIPSEKVLEKGFLELIAGRIYVNLERGAELFYGDYPLEYEVDDSASGTDILTNAPTKFNIEKAGPSFLIKLPWYMYLMFKSGRIFRNSARDFSNIFEEETLPRFNEYFKKAKSENLASFSHEKLLNELSEREAVLNEFGKETLKPSMFAAYYHSRLVQDLLLVFGPEEGKQISSTLLKGLVGDKTVEANIALYKVSRNEQSFDEFLREFGHRAVGEFELAEPRWGEDPGFPKKIVENYRNMAGLSPVEMHEKQIQERLAVERTLADLLKARCASSLEPEIRKNMEAALKFLPYRETGKYHFMKSIALVRDVLKELAEKWDLGRDLFFLRKSELSDFPKRQSEMREAIKRRKIRWQSLQRLDVPELIKVAELDNFGKPKISKDSEGGVFVGNGIAPGVNTGTARIVKSPSDVANLGQKYVIICTSTDPGWTPLFVHARGLVVERGGMLSHGAIVARDFGIPAVVIKEATQKIQDGCEVKIDGNSGKVEIVK
ncbi:MAG: hypothetical protein HQM08_09395 [Candidatus Riflebacteria bacterium]|nr:hypothetical protein [Candidatus Riflebacteria bacterium]